MWQLRSAILLALFLHLPSHARGQADDKKPSPAALHFFESKVRPLLAENCFKCHGPQKHKGNLRLDSRAAMLTGGDEGPAIVPGDPGKSLLIKAVLYDDNDLKMPPSKKLSPDQLAVLSDWIKMGAPWPEADKSSPAPARKGEMQVTDKDRQHWSFQPVKRPTLPKVKNEAWVANPIDAFILAKLEGKGLEPNGPAPRQELVRRLYYDLTGLPPSPAQVEFFLADASPDAYEKLVDRLLASPHFGEKWGRHWLDLVRFAETNSYEYDNPKPHAWRYRDYVIRALNEDKPYDRFIREQLAGDEMPNPSAAAIIATGYYRLGVWDEMPSDRELSRYDGLDDIVATTSQVFLGLTVDCARCHDHKIDPIPQKDYYRLLAFFHNIHPYRNGGPLVEVDLSKTSSGKILALNQQRNLQAKLAMYHLEIREAQQQAAAKQEEIPDEGDVLGEERYKQYQALKDELATFQHRPVLLWAVLLLTVALLWARAMPDEMGCLSLSSRLGPGTAVLVGVVLCLILVQDSPPPQRVPALGVTENGGIPPDTFVHLRGNYQVSGPLVKPGFLQVLTTQEPSIPPVPPYAKTTGRRTVLAEWIASPENQLTARVMVNRLWQYHFGHGIVRSASDFGFQGTRPTHPELLDWLAAEFVARDWSMKAMHRLMLNSNTYKMSSKGNTRALAQDPTNDLFWRFDMRRLTAEEIRDSILAVSGNLNLKMFGPSVYPDMPKELLAGQSDPGKGWERSLELEQNRRSIYIHVKRSLLHPLLETFDLAEADRPTAVRFATTQPTQALTMLNSDFLGRQAKVFAQRLRTEAGSDVNRQVSLAWRLATGRPPGEDELRRCGALIDALRARDGLSAEAALETFCLMVLNLNEFVYLD